GEEIQGGDVDRPVAAVGVDIEVVDPAHKQRVQHVVVDRLHDDRGGGAHVVGDRRVRVLRAVHAVRVAQRHLQRADLGRGKLAGLVPAVGEDHRSALEDIGGDVVVLAGEVAAGSPVDGDGVARVEGGGD